MYYIVYDLEFILLKRRQYLADIIEIGAIKLKEINHHLEVVDFYQSFVRPKDHSNISNETIEFTGILQDDINRAPSFSEMVRDFNTWLGEEEYYLVSWGPDDKFQLLRHCNQYNITADWVKNYNDLQEQITLKVKRDKHQPIGLSNALEYFTVQFEGAPHRAIHDAFNTAKILSKFYSELTFEKNTPEEDLTYITRVVYESGDDEPNMPFANLADLLHNSV